MFYFGQIALWLLFVAFVVMLGVLIQPIFDPALPNLNGAPPVYVKAVPEKKNTYYAQWLYLWFL